MAVNGKSRRSYRGAPVSNTLGVTLSVGATNITLAVAMAGWSTDGEPFFVVVDPGTAKEEKICVKYSTSTTLTVVDPAATSTWGASGAGRGADNTVDRQHEQGAVIYPVFTALEANQANELVSKYANPGSVVYQGSGSPVGAPSELAIGTAGQILKVNTGATAPEWGQVAAAGIADGAVTSAKILDGTIVVDDIADGAITSAKILNNTIVLGDLATALQAFLVPVGSINAYAGATAPTGWLMCDGTSTTGYTALAALVGATTPDLRGKFAMGKTATGTGSTLLGTDGSNTISTGNLPSHSHANTATASTSATVNGAGGHSHTASSGGAGGHGHALQATTFATAVSHAHNNISDYASAGTNGQPTVGGGIPNAVTSVGDHSHSVTVDAVGDHSHTASASTTVTMSNANTGSGTAYFQPFVAVNYIIKHD